MVLHLGWAVPAITSSVYSELLPNENRVLDSFKEKMNKFPVLFVTCLFSGFCVTWICGLLILDISSSCGHRRKAGSVRLVRGTKLKD
ncbi:hypothetical protein M9H77_02619 [Catharanthus roseus]|uniref:Uncharacterized protein n=1 Tax=Catharanthus roseus TaxID=4058 RepID=A0ACC0C936_CATRO|nr:hypothetical protein M9H77_02619 [Catharanthus roseus]